MINFCIECEGLMKPVKIHGKIVYQCIRCGIIKPFKQKKNSKISNIIILYDKALDLLNQSNFEQASKFFNRVIDLDPSDEESWYHIGFIHLYQNNLKKAFFSFKSTLTINPEFIDAWYGIGIIYDKIGLFEEAIEAYSNALDEDPEIFSSNWLFYIDKLIQKSKFFKALNEIEVFEEICNTYLLEYFYYEVLKRKDYIKKNLTKREEKSPEEFFEESSLIDLSFKDALAKKGIRTLFHITDISKIPSILKNGLLCRNAVKEIDIDLDYYLKNAQKQGEINMKMNYNDDICDYTRLFFVSDNPMLRKILFSYHLYDTTAIIQIDPEIMDFTERLYFTNTSCTKKDFNRFSSPNNLNNLEWNYLLDDYEKYISLYKMENKLNEYQIFKEKRGAEVLIFEKVPREYINSEILVFSLNAKKKLIKVLTRNDINLNIISIKVDKDRKFFPLSTRSKNYWKKINKYR